MKNYIVVGAGILGASTAYHLAKAGVNVTVVDRQDQGQATDAAAGIVCPWLSQRRNKTWYRLVKGGANYYPLLIEKLKQDGETETGYEKVGTISIHTDEEKLNKIEERVLKRREDAAEIGEVTRLSASKTKELFPSLSEKYSSVHISGGARVDGRALRNALLNAAKKNGANLVVGDAKLDFQGNRVTGIKIEDKLILADHVIVTAGAWSKEILEPLGVNFLVTSQKAQIIHLKIPGMDTSNWPVIMPPTNQYLLTFKGGKVVIGATHENDIGIDNRVTAGGVYEVLDKALTVAPELDNATIDEIRVGFRPFTPGFLPVFGALPNFTGIFVANGLGASGLTAGPYFGFELAKLALGIKTELDPDDFDLAGAIEEMI